MGRDASAAADKDRLRTALLAARKSRPPDELEAARAAIRTHVLARVAGVRRVAAYVPMRTEPGSTELLAALRAGGADVIVPVTMPDRDLDWADWTPAGPGALLGVEAVMTADLVLAPALAVARDGTRLGRGGGSYDRALRRCRPDAFVAALVFDDEVVDGLPRDEWDVPVGAAVTPGGWIEVGNGNTEVQIGR
jgi:5-formyltetrahydrofolate cyclo-ligase